MSIEKTNISTVIKELGLPKSSVYLGYVIHQPESDDFLAAITIVADSSKRIFCKHPDVAKRYVSYNDALNEANRCILKAEVLILFDTGDEFHVAPVDG